PLLCYRHQPSPTCLQIDHSAAPPTPPLSLHDALPIYDVAIESRLVSKTIESAQSRVEGLNFDLRKRVVEFDDVINKQRETIYAEDRKSTRLNSSHVSISYAVFCLKKQNH